MEKIEQVVKHFRNQITTVVIQTSHTTDKYHVPKGVLVKLSGAFAKEINSKLKSGQPIILRDADDETIQVFIHWLCCKGEGLPSMRRPQDEDSDREAIALVKIWCFGEKWELPSLQNAALTKIIDLQLNAPDLFGPGVLLAALRCTSMTSKLAKLLFKIAQFEFPQSTSKQTLTDPDFNKVATKLVQIPGFFTHWIAATRKCRVSADTEQGETKLYATSILRLDPEEYMVPEQASLDTGTAKVDASDEFSDYEEESEDEEDQSESE